jgi:hypothetical protein
MEILRFEEAATSAPKRKKSSKSYLAVGFVATIFGLGSAFASNTIEINGSAPIALGQGVILVTACDTEVSVVPVTEMIVENPGGPTFYMNELQIGGISAAATDAVSGLGCGGKTFDVQIYDGENTAYSCAALNIDYDGPASVAGDEANPTCTGTGSNKISFDVLVAGSSDYIITFNEAPSDIGYITLITRETPVG